MAASDKIRWKRMVNEIRFLHNEKSLVEEINKESAPQFQEHYVRFAAENGLDLVKLNAKNSDVIDELYGKKATKISSGDFPDFEDATAGTLVPYTGAEKEPETKYNDTQDDLEIHESFKKLFKRLAMKLHPDKVGNQVTIEQGMENLILFKKAKNALDEKKYFVLLDLAEQFCITHSRDYKQQIRWMKRESQSINLIIHKEKDTYNYLFSESETDEQKNALVRRFILQLFKIHDKNDLTIPPHSAILLE